MRTGIFGGTFDPPHMGHLIAVEAARELLHLDLVRVIPAAVSPHKLQMESSPAAMRLTMTLLAFGGNSAFTIDERELRREGPSYMVDTLVELHRESPGDEFYLMIGKDNIAEFGTWKEPERIFQLCKVVSLNRPLPPGAYMEDLSDKRIQHLDTPLVEVSSSTIRERVRARKSIRYLVPDTVYEYIVDQKLYLE